MDKFASRAYRVILTASLLAVLTIAPGFGVPGAKASIEDLFSGVTTAIAPYSPDPAVNVDGKVSPGEYDSNVTFTASGTDISLSLLHDNDSLFIVVQGPAWRWVAIGVSSDGASTMGFVVITGADSGFLVQERLVTAVSEDMTFTTPPAGRQAVVEFDASFSGNHTIAEMQLNLESSVWSLEPGLVYPTVVASNLTAPPGIPGGVSGGDVHFAGSYLLRPEDNVKKVNDLLNGEISPLPSLVAAAALSFGVIAIFMEFVIRRREK